MAPTDPKFGINVTVEVTDLTRELLVGVGWTPPGQEPHTRGAGDDVVTRAAHNARMESLVADQRRAFDRLRHQHQEELDQQAKEHFVALREARRKSAAATRAEVAEEIAKDLEKPREWRISVEEPAPWAKIARAHAGKTTSSSPAPTQLDPVCTLCSHLVAMHGRGGCAATVSTGRGSSKWCDCARTYASGEPWWWDTSTAPACPPSCGCHRP